MDAQQYLNNVHEAIKANQYAREFYFPSNKSQRKRMNLRLAREIGVGLNDSPEFNDWGSLYGRFIVMFSFDTTGVCVDAKEFFREVRSQLVI